MALRSHLENIDKLADFQTERLRQLKMKFANEQETLIFEFDTEREMLVQQNQTWGNNGAPRHDDRHEAELC